MANVNGNSGDGCKKDILLAGYRKRSLVGFDTLRIMSEDTRETMVMRQTSTKSARCDRSLSPTLFGYFIHVSNLDLPLCFRFAQKLPN